MTPDLDQIADALARREPVMAAPPDDPWTHAAVALILHRSERGVELLLIERARRDGDHWSGDMAFPGGRREAVDRTIVDTASREVREEIGVDLPAPMARLDDYDARTGRRPWPLLVSPFVYVLEDRPETTLNHEVEAVVWTPLAALLDPASAIRHSFHRASTHVVVPALRVDGDRVVWGMTHRMLESFTTRLGHPLPRP